MTYHDLCPSLTVPNLLPNVDELTILVQSGDYSWSFWQWQWEWQSIQIVFFSSVLLRQARTKVLNMFKTFVFPMRILFIPGYEHWKRVLFFVVQPTWCTLGCPYCILVVLTVYYIVRICKISPEASVKYEEQGWNVPDTAVQSRYSC